MTNSESSTRRILLAGDLTVDWNLAHVPGSLDNGSDWTDDCLTKACCQRGGSAMLADLLHEVLAELRTNRQINAVLSSTLPQDISITPQDDRFHHCYSMWHPYDSGEKLNGKPKLIWRVSKFLGIDPATTKPDSPQTAVLADTSAEIIMLDDLALGLRHEPNAWPQALHQPDFPGWIVYKMMRPVAEGALWNHLVRNCAERTILVMTAEDLRRSEVQISRRISWERTAQDLFWELTQNPRVNGASRCAHVIVSFHTAGAFLLSRQFDRNNPQQSTWRARLFFDPEVGEDNWGPANAGKVMGNTITLTASLIRQLLLNSQEPDFTKGIQAGIRGTRQLFQEGFGTFSSAQKTELRFPAAALAKGFANETDTLAVTEIRDPNSRLTKNAIGFKPGTSFWTILEDQYSNSLDQVSQEIVLRGLKSALRGVPRGRFGFLQTVDRSEIEALRSIQALIAEYMQQESQKRPLSIAVFGPPGSGKSFGVEQVAKAVTQGQIEIKTFNLSQFSDPDDLLGALHQVRDIGLRGKLPLVFWDEFDSSLQGVPLGWLRYFLAPMQDGSFQQGQITHPIGRCIFVFAGGTSYQMAKFGDKLTQAEFQAAKGPDFVSRLKGFLNVLGPNRQADEKNGDPFFIIRRAILLRSIFERNTPQLFRDVQGQRLLSIDPGVLRALLRTNEYKHGVRSIESLISMSALAGRTSFERSSLPSEQQLDLHVQGLAFLALLQEIELTGEILEKLAEQAHEVFCDGKRRDGWTLGGEKNADKKTHPLLVPYHELHETFRESNRATVRNIPKKLARAGYIMIPCRNNEFMTEFPGDDLEALAEYEHELWMENEIARNGQGEDGKPRHVNLVPWHELSEQIKEIDRDMVRGIPRILAAAGYTVFPLNKSK